MKKPIAVRKSIAQPDTKKEKTVVQKQVVPPVVPELVAQPDGQKPVVRKRRVFANGVAGVVLVAFLAMLGVIGFAMWVNHLTEREKQASTSRQPAVVSPAQVAAEAKVTELAEKVKELEAEKALTPQVPAPSVPAPMMEPMDIVSLVEPVQKPAPTVVTPPPVPDVPLLVKFVLFEGTAPAPVVPSTTAAGGVTVGSPTAPTLVNNSPVSVVVNPPKVNVTVNNITTTDTTVRGARSYKFASDPTKPPEVVYDPPASTPVDPPKVVFVPVPPPRRYKAPEYEYYPLPTRYRRPRCFLPLPILIPTPFLFRGHGGGYRGDSFGGGHHGGYGRGDDRRGGGRRH